MELRDFYADPNLIREECSSLIHRCDQYMRLHPQSKLWLRDTDHTYSPIRLESENVPKEDYDEISSYCPKCGSTIQPGTINNQYYEDYGFTFCNYCNALTEEDGWKKLVRLLLYLNRIDEIEQTDNNTLFGCIAYFSNNKTGQNTERQITDSYICSNLSKAERYRVRVITGEGHVLYLTLNRLRMDNKGKLYIEHKSDKSDIVRYAGIRIKGRDRNGNRLYQGDIVTFDFIDYQGKRRKWEGVLRSCRLTSKSILYVIEDNLYNNFPPPPDKIDNTTIEIIGNIFDPNCKVNGEEAKYYIPLITGKSLDDYRNMR